MESNYVKSRHNVNICNKELRDVKSHIKTEILIGKWNKYILYLGVKVKEAYSDEYKMPKEIIADIGSS